MATITSTASGVFSAGATWVGGVAPADNTDGFVIAAGHNVQMDQDQAAWTGLLGGVISGHATTPGSLYWKDGTSGTLKLKTGYNLVGTTVGGGRGRLIANSDGAFATTTALAYATKAIILHEGTSKLDATNLDINMRCAEPTNKYVTTYKTKYDFTASAGTVNTTTGVIDIGTTPPAANTAIKIRSLGGVLPAGLSADDIYYVYGVSGNTLKLALQSNVAVTVVIPTDVGSGALTLYIGHTDTATGAMSVFEDVFTSDSWTTGDRVVLANIGPQNYDQQRATATITSASVITLSANVDSVQYPGARIWLVSRNVSIRSSGATAAQPIVDWSGSTHTGSTVNAEIVNTAGTGTTFYGQGTTLGVSHNIGGAISGCVRGVYAGTSHNVSAVLLASTYGAEFGTGHTFSGPISGCSVGINTGTSAVLTSTAEITGCTTGISGAVLCTVQAGARIVGCSTGLATCVSPSMAGVVSGCTIGINGALSVAFIGAIRGCLYGSSASQTCAFTGTIDRCTTGISADVVPVVTGTVSNCTTGLSVARSFMASGATFSGNTADITHTAATLGNIAPSRSFRHGGTANDTRAWSSGGTLTHTTTAGEYPTGKTYAHKFTHTNASYYTVMEWEITRPMGGPLSLVVHAKHDATSLTEAQRIHWEIVDRASDPFAGGTALDQFIAVDSTSWQSDTLTHTKTDDRPLLLRAYCTRASGNSYIYAEEQVNSAGGGSPIIGGSIVRRA